MGTTTRTFQVALKGLNQYKTIDHTKVPLALVSKQKWATHVRQLTKAVPMLVHRTRSN